MGESDSSYLLWYSPMHGFVQPDSQSGFGSLIDSDEDGEVTSPFVRIPFNQALSDLHAVIPDTDGDIYTDSLDPWKDLSCDGTNKIEEPKEEKKDVWSDEKAEEKAQMVHNESDPEGIDPVKYILGVYCPSYKQLPEYKTGCKPIYAFHRRSNSDPSSSGNGKESKKKKKMI